MTKKPGIYLSKIQRKVKEAKKKEKHKTCQALLKSTGYRCTSKLHGRHTKYCGRHGKGK
jgi:hypothetical protein